MMKIATHNSATGERPGTVLSWLVLPFARCQRKSIIEQYEAGCRSFDIRVRRHKGEWRCAHGLFITARTVEHILAELNALSSPQSGGQEGGRCQVCVTYEGGASCTNAFIDAVQGWKRLFPRIVWGGIAIKYGQVEGGRFSYTTLATAEDGYEGGVQGFLPLDGRSWHSLLPVPWLWNLIYTRKHVFDENRFTFVDFL